ncbi:MAG: molybdopterin-dependent oxidoreductase [Anaerolineaceae bacterium]|nr:molybdopterin-dependent oxidoreductase [Anaerolineaceae bacterium]
MINLTIDNKQIQVEDNSTVLQAAKAAGIDIPTLCDHPELTPWGGCRLCLVDVQGARTLQPSCTLPVSENMVVLTNTDRIKEVRKFLLSLVFSERNHFCPFCQVSGGDCELQNAAYAEGMTHWPLSPNFSNFPVDASHDYIVLEQNRCILCRRCVRACDELVGNSTLGFEERGANSMLVADFGVPLGQSTCISCGMCVQVCPTGALIDRWSAYKGQDAQVEVVKTVCSACSVGCSLQISVRDNHIVKIEGDWEGAVNRGVVCEFGRFEPMVDDRERITTPLIRKDGKLVPATWEEALEAAAKGLLAKKTDLAAVISSRLSVESMHAFKQIFGDQLKAKVVTSTEEGQFTREISKYADDLKKPFESKLDLLKASDCVIAFGSDLLDNHQVAGFFVKRNIMKGSKLVLVSSKDTTLDNKTDVVLSTKVKSADVVTALTHAVDHLNDEAALAEDAAKAGISVEMMKKAAKAISNALWPTIVLGSDVTADLLKAAKAFSDKTKAAIITLKGSANSLAAAQYQLEQSIVAGTQAGFIALGDEKPSQHLIQTMEKTGYLVLQASYKSPLTARADVVLPVGTWTEQDGHFLNLDGRLQESRTAVKTVAEIHTNEAVLKDLAKALGLKVQDGWKKELSNRVSAVKLEL